FVDKCLSIENLVDRHAPYFNSPKKEYDIEKHNPFKKKEYGYYNPDEEREQKIEEEKEKKKTFAPQRDVLHFLIQQAPLENWQQDILSIIRDEAYYFAPQGMTKVMNEGWASYWHTTMMTNGLLTDAEVIDYADHHSGATVMPPTGFNPYKIGIELF